MSKYWSELNKRITPYRPGEQPRDKKYIKLNTNENPYPPSPLVLAALREAANGDLRLYPDPTCDELRAVVAESLELDKGQVFCGNGSDELLAFAFLAFFNPGRTILFPDVTYSFYPVYAGIFNIDYRLVRLKEDFSLPLEDFFVSNGGIIIANPNAPTGKYIPPDAVQRILSHNINSVVIIDEAYIAFGGESAVRLINTYPNLLIIRTLSKSHSLAGLRIGFALGDSNLIEALGRIKSSINSYTLDRMAIAGAIAAIKDTIYIEETVARIIATRDRISSALVKMGFRITDSKSNFLFISHPQCRAVDLFQKFRLKGILVRYFDRPRIDNFLRLSIGSDEEMDIFLKVMAEIIMS